MNPRTVRRWNFIFILRLRKSNMIACDCRNASKLHGPFRQQGCVMHAKAEIDVAAAPAPVAA